MIAVDTSALMAIVLDEPAADSCMGVLDVETQVLISAGTLAEALIVAARRKAGQRMAQLIDGLGLTAFESAVAEIQLLGTTGWIGRTLKYLNEHAQRGVAIIDPVLEILRADQAGNGTGRRHTRRIVVFRFTEKEDEPISDWSINLKRARRLPDTPP
nr:type II toxin-antitoxin system VapC family toxin [uncultured Rhodopila sp.]